LRDWLGNARGEWYVLGQAILALFVLVAPALDGHRPAIDAGWPAVAVAAGGLCIAAGVLLAVLASLGLGRSLSPFPRPNPDARLVETGVYSLVRHPIYTGLSLAALGWGLLWRSPAALVAALVLFTFLDLKSRREERWLVDRFEGYRSYQSRVKRLIPYLY
jgi:protein-S-isoprenylcysteine O-methyltransferase Ste14